MRSPIVRAALAALLTASLAGCYPLKVNAYGIDKPVSLSESLGEKVRFTRHFRYEFVTWYAIGMIPLFSLPGDVPALMPADRMVSSLLRTELEKGGDGIVNLRVTQEYSLFCFLAGFASSYVISVMGAGNPRMAPTFITVGQLWGWGFQPMGAVVEGDVVTKAQVTDRLPPRAITLRGKRLDLAGLNLRTVVQPKE